MLGALEGVVEYKKAGGFTEDFWLWAGKTALTTAIAIPVVGAAASWAITTFPVWGTAGVIALAGAGLYVGIRSIAQEIVTVYADEPDSYLYIGASKVLDFMHYLEGKAVGFITTAASAISELFGVNSAQAAELENGFENVEVETVKFASAGGVAHTLDEEEGKPVWLWGEEDGVIIGGEGNDWLFHSGFGEALGLAGDDVLIGLFSEFVTKGTPIGPEPAEGAEDTRRIAETDLRLTLDGGEGDDWLIALGGTGAILVGGEGRDFLFNTSFKGQLYGDTLDGVGQSTSGTQDSDVFWYWPSTFIMDAQPNDILQMFGWPLLGGSNSVAGIYAGDGSLAIDWLNWTVFYGASKSGQLLIFNAIAMALGIGGGTDEDPFPAGVMVVEDYDFGGWKDKLRQQAETSACECLREALDVRMPEQGLSVFGWKDAEWGRPANDNGNLCLVVA